MNNVRKLALLFALFSFVSCMDEDISIINSNTRNEKIKNFFLNNKKKLLAFLLVVVIMLIFFFSYEEFKDYQRQKVSNLFYSNINRFKNILIAEKRIRKIDLWYVKFLFKL